MSTLLEPTPAESLSELWALLHKTSPIAVLDSEVHYLTSMALAADDDTVSHLLLKKLRLATIAATTKLPDGTVRMNSYVEFVHGTGAERFCQLLHPSAPNMPPYGLSITSLAGAGLIGLRSGQTILWPDAAGTLADLRIIHVENCAGIDRWLQSPA